jgi:hypothetical protein
MFRALLFALGVCALAQVVVAADWPTAARDAARTGRTSDAVAAPFRVRWAKAWQYENIATVAQLIVVEGRGFIGTLGRDGSLAGRVHAVDVVDGRDLWSYDDLQGGVAHTLTWSPAAGGTVYAATTAGEVAALDAATGRPRWKFAAPLGGFVVNPCVADGAVLLGSRQGEFYALNETDGAIRWRFRARRPICQTAAAADGVVYFLDEGMYAYALRTDSGAPVEGWIPRQLHGGSARFYWPVVTREHVLLTVAPPHQYNFGETDGVLFQTPGVQSRKEGNYFAVGTPEEEAAEQKLVIDFLRARPHNRVMHCLRRDNGRDASLPGVLYTGGSGSECAPPVLTADDRIVVEYRSYYSLWDSDSWVNPYSALGTLDPATGVVTQLRPRLQGERVPWGHVWIIADESSSFTVAGETLLISHQGNFGGVELATGKTFAGVGKRDTWGGYPPLSWSRQEWHGGPRSPLTVVDGTVYYVVGGRVIACEGNARPGGKDAEPTVVPSPTPIAPLPEFRDDAKHPTVEELAALLKDEITRQRPPIDAAATAALRAALDAHVAELLEDPWHGPFHEWRGLAPSARTMAEPAELAYALALAAPHLSAERRQAVRAYIERQLAADPLTPRGEPRNYHRIDPLDFRATRPTLELPGARQDFYAQDTFVALFGAQRPDELLFLRAWHSTWRANPGPPEGPVADGLKGAPPEQWRRAARYSRGMNHLAGRVRYAHRLDDARAWREEVERFALSLAHYLDHYRRIGRACAQHIDALPGGEWHPSAGGQNRNLGGPYLGQIHMQAIVFWTDLSPEMGRVLRAYAPEESAAIQRWVLRNAQGFYLVRWDTPVQEGENGAPWYVTTQNYFHLFSTIGPSDFAAHQLLVDRPACRADVYYLERLVRAIEASGGT